MELFDLADTRFGTTATWDYPSVTNYEPSNLLHKRPITESHLLSPLSTPTGCIAESFVKPPIELHITLPFPVSLAAITVNPRIRMHTVKHISVFVMSDRGYKWEFLGKMSWDENASMWQGVCNKELSPIQVEQAREQATRIGTWIPVERTDALLHFVSHVKIRVSAMHNAVALGIGGIEIWAQPSQRMPWRQREQAWTTIRKVTTEQNAEPAKDTTKKTLTDCPPEFIDTITQNIMQDPVILPSNKRCDRSTITRHLAAHSTDPFTGLPLNITQIRPDLSLQLRIRAWHNK